MTRLLLSVNTFLLSAMVLSAQTSLQKIVTEFATASDLRAATVGISVVDVETGRELAAHESDRSVVPASNLKVVTTATALGILGPDYRYTTRLAYDGRIDAQGVLRGNLYIIGSGDPTLGSSELEDTSDLETLLTRLRMAVQQAGIRRIEGQVIGDASVWSSQGVPDGWQWNDLGNYYGAGAYGLNIHENLYYLQLQQRGQLGARPEVAATDPALPNIRWANELRSAARGTGDNAYIYGGPGSYDRALRGTIPVGSGRFTIKGSLPEPPLQAAQWLETALTSVGIVATQGAALTFAESEKTLTTLHTHQSPPLREIVERTNRRSVNLYAEALLRTLGQRYNGEGTEVVTEFWQDRGLSLDGVFLADGSGLSPDNGTPARFLAQLLRKAYVDEKIRESLWESLPVAGERGSLRGLQKTAAAGRLRAKSGTLNRVRSFSGYARTREGQLLAFSVIVNRYPGSGGQMRQRLYRLLTTFCS